MTRSTRETRRSFVNSSSTFAGLLAIAVALHATPSQAQVYELSEQDFSNSEFRARFAQSYLAESEVNPSITPQEKGLFDAIAPMIQSDPRGAIARLQQAITPETSAAFDFILGNLLYQEDHVEASIQAYEAAIAKFPNYFRAYYNAGRACVADGDYRSALAKLQKAISIQPGDGALYGLIGYCYLNLDQPSTALDAYRNAIMLAPESRDWRLGKLQCHVAMEQHKEAIALLYEFLQAEPENADWWKLQANQFLALKETAKAAANLTALKEMGKADGPSLFLLADLMLNEGLVAEARDTYLVALGERGAQPRRVLDALNSLVAMDELESAATLAARFDSTLAPELDERLELDYLNIKARLAMKRDDVDGAAAHLHAVVERDPLNGQALLTLSDLEKRRGDLARAEFYAENASKLDAFAHKAFLSLAQLNVGKRDYRSAAKYLRQAQQIKPQDYVADYLLKVEQAALRM